MQKRGFTLVELLVAMTIMTILSSGIFYALGTQLRGWNRVIAAGEKEQIIDMLITALSRDIRNAAEILPGSNQNLLQLRTGTDVVKYSLSAKKVKKEKNNYTTYLTDNNKIASLSFAYPAPKLIEMKIESVTTRFALRN